VGAKSLTLEIANRRVQIDDYCRQVEAYLCQKNDGHLIRVVGPSFDLVSGWAVQGVPLKVVFSGVDRCLDRNYRSRRRRRPVKIDFCEADVLDAFDEWRRAVGLSAGVADPKAGSTSTQVDGGSRRESLSAHLERVVTRLTASRARGRIGPAFDRVIDLMARELDLARAAARGLRGEARAALIRRLAELDRDLLGTARATLDDASRAALASEAAAELASFRDRMDPEAFARAREAAFDRLLRERLDLPTVTRL
jgi:hypothetical protein